MVEFSDLPTKARAEDSNRTSGSSASEQGTPNSSRKRKSDSQIEGNKKKKKKSKAEKSLKANGVSNSRRRHSVSKPARDPRDEVFSGPGQGLSETRSPSPVIDFDGLSRPSRCNVSQL
jgi:GTP cyclohydrolase I